MEVRKKTKWSLEKVLQIFEQNEIRNVTHLQQISPGALTWAYKNCVMDQLPFTNKGGTRKKKNYHDINKVIGYLERWAAEEHTTVQVQANKYGYGEEYRDLQKMNKNQ